MNVFKTKVTTFVLITFMSLRAAFVQCLCCPYVSAVTTINFDICKANAQLVMSLGTSVALYWSGQP